MSVKLVMRYVGDVTIIDSADSIVLNQGGPILLNAVPELASQGRDKVILNLADTTYFDSTGMGELLSSFTVLGNFGPGLKLLAVGELVKKLIELTNLNQVFEIFDDEATAIRSFA